MITRSRSNRSGNSTIWILLDSRECRSRSIGQIYIKRSPFFVSWESNEILDLEGQIPPYLEIFVENVDRSKIFRHGLERSAVTSRPGDVLSYVPVGEFVALRVGDGCTIIGYDWLITRLEAL